MNFENLSVPQFTSPPFYQAKQSNEDPFPKKDSLLTCLSSHSYSSDEQCVPSTFYGYHKPLNETCPPIKQSLSNAKIEDNGCQSIWNNMTKRKSLVNV